MKSFLYLTVCLGFALSATAQPIQPMTIDIPKSPDGEMPENVSELYSKLSAQESALADLTAQVEKLSFELNALSDRVSKMNADVDLRFTALEPKTTPLKTAEKSNPTSEYEAAYTLLKQGHFKQAEVAFTTFLEKHPTDKLAGNANYWLGETYYARGQYEQAVGIFADGFTKYKDNTKAPDNLLKLGMSMEKLGKKDEACTAFKSLPVEFKKASKSLKDKAGEAAQKLACP